MGSGKTDSAVGFERGVSNVRVMLKASYSRAQKGEKGKHPELVSAEYGEIPDKLVMGELALGVMLGATNRGDHAMADLLAGAIEAAKKDGVLETLR